MCEIWRRLIDAEPSSNFLHHHLENILCEYQNLTKLIWRACLKCSETSPSTPFRPIHHISSIAALTLKYLDCILCHIYPWHDDVIKWNIIRVTGPLCGEFTGHRWIPRTKASDAELWCFLWSGPWTNGWVNNREAGDFRRHCAHYDVSVMGTRPHMAMWHYWMNTCSPTVWHIWMNFSTWRCVQIYNKNMDEVELIGC